MQTAAEYQNLLVEAAQAVAERRTAFHGGAPLDGEHFALVVAAPQAIAIPGGHLLSVGISRQQAHNLGGRLLRWAAKPC